MSWSQIKLEEIVAPQKASLVSGPFGSSIGSRFFVPAGVPVIRGNNLSKGSEKFIDDGYVFLTEEKATEFPKCVAIADDLIFTAAGSIGQVGIIPKVSKFNRYIISNKQIRLRLDRSKADPLFVYYWLSSRRMVAFIESQNNGGAVPLLNLGIIRRLPVPLPDLPTQERIAGVLSAYDDLVENNRRRIALLEQAARLLYREWFIHFRFPGSETTKLVDGLPEGWKRRPISEIWDISYGKNLPKTKITETGRYPVHGADGIIGYFEKENVFESMCLVTCRGNGSGNVRRTFGPTFVTNNCFVFRPKHKAEGIRFHFAMNACETLKMQDMRTGAAQPQLTLAGISHVNSIVPEDDALQSYNEIADPIWSEADNLRRQNNKLAKARDLLLPRLMDERLPIPE